MPRLKQGTQDTITFGPLIDNSDFKTLETAVAHNAAGINVDVIKDDGTKVDLSLQSTAGDGYWAHNAQGLYKLTLSSTDTSAIGKLRVMFYATGVLPCWEHYLVLPANEYDSLVAGTDALQVDVVEVSGDSTAADNLELLTENALGADNKMLVSSDAQDLSATFDVNAKAISADTTAADNLELLTENALGADNKILISTDAQDRSTTLHVNAKAIEGKALSAKAGDNFDVFFQNAGGDTTKTVDDVGTPSAGDATEAKQDAIITDLDDLKGTGFVKDTDSVVDLAHIGADGDTLETLSDQIDAAFTQPGSYVPFTYSVTAAGVAVPGVDLLVSTDDPPTSYVWHAKTDASGEAILMVPAGTIYIFASKRGFTPDAYPDTEVAS